MKFRIDYFDGSDTLPELRADLSVPESLDLRDQRKKLIYSDLSNGGGLYFAASETIADCFYHDPRNRRGAAGCVANMKDGTTLDLRGAWICGAGQFNGLLHYQEHVVQAGGHFFPVKYMKSLFDAEEPGDRMHLICAIREDGNILYIPSHASRHEGVVSKLRKRKMILPSVSEAHLASRQILRSATV